MSGSSLNQKSNSSSEPPFKASPEVYIGFGLLTLILLRAWVSFSMIIYWQTDPRASINSDGSPGAITSFGPIGLITTDLLIILLSVIGVSYAVWRSGRRHDWLILAWVGVFIGVAYHAYTSLPATQIGTTWFACLSVTIAAFMLGHLQAFRQIIIAGLIAILPAFAMKAAYQKYVEYPATIDYFQKHKEEVLKNRGFEPDSPNALQFERRLIGQDVTANFTLANVFASVLIMLITVSAGLALAAWKNPTLVSTGLRTWLILLNVFGLAALAATFSKGAVLTLVIILTGIGLMYVLSKTNRLTQKLSIIMCIGIVAIGIIGVLIRGAAGTPDSPAGERSLLFRYFYWQAGMKMLLNNPITGVGPDKFGEQYLIQKNKLSPEDVSDPHNIFVTMLSTLGISGLIFVFILLYMITQIGVGMHAKLLQLHEIRRHAPPPDEEPHHHNKQELAVFSASVLGTLFVAGVVFVIDFKIRQSELWIQPAAVWMLSLIAFIGTMTGLLNKPKLLEHPITYLGVIASALAIMLHNQIELAMTHHMAGPALFLIVGLAAGITSKTHNLTAPLWRKYLTLLLGVIILSSSAFGLYPIYQKESAYQKAEMLMRAGLPMDAIHSLLLNHEQSEGRDVKIASGLLFESAIIAHQKGNHSFRDKMILMMLQLLEKQKPNHHQAVMLHHTADLCLRAMAITQGPVYVMSQRLAVIAADALLKADPFGLESHLLAADIFWAVGEKTEATSIYKKVLELNKLKYLDPLTQLTNKDQIRVTNRTKDHPN